MTKNYVKEYKGYKVPEGATHYKKKSTSYLEGFYKTLGEGVNESIKFCGVEDGSLWVGGCLGMFGAIELPEAPQEWSGEGLPPVGTLCTISADGFEYLFSASSNELSSITENTELVVVGHCTRHDNGAECVTLMARDSRDARGFTTVNPEFITPLKTQREKELEAFHLKARGVYKCRMSCDEFATALYEAGFKAPKEEV